MLQNRKIKQPPPGQPKPPLTQLKELPPDTRAQIGGILRANTYEQAQPLIEQLLGFSCSTSVLFRFYQWHKTQDAMEISEDAITQVVSFLQESYPDWTEEKMRQSASAFFAMHAVSKRDIRGFTSIARLGLQSGRDRVLAERLEFDKAKAAQKVALNRQRLQLDKLKFKESKLRKLEVGLDAIGASFKKNPKALALYQQAVAIIDP
jgi:hypothetical protein